MIVDFTGVTAIVTRLAIAIFLIAAGVTVAELLEFEFEEPAFLFHIAVQVILLVPTVTTVLTAVVTELQLQPPNEYPPREKPLSVGVVKVWPFDFSVSVGVVPEPPLRL